MAERLRLAHLTLLIGPAALLGGAFAFQHIGGLHPCEMCIWQRWPHAAALVLASLALFVPGTGRRALLLLAALAELVTAGIGVFHAGVEQRWWQGPSACSATDLGTGDFLSSVLATPVVQCDQIAWSLAGISMAGYNAILSGLIAGVALWLILKR
ncbi:disulfide bond formation protein B [Sphingosinicella soli]|uniref:Disulfide bond formation protein DsbB n=1 Tax=Sphingosinicella soli TaxID=333708 RepID=A0A7W7B0C7_9SPHN|nr:disulfide bond formation protein B [Sphingosinicella soli]MBB4631696.1 disulfide bond formation protein DsbB [Sphingosinicella soli]